LAVSAAALALAAVAQAIVVISGGIDLSIGAMMAFTNVVAAAAMSLPRHVPASWNVGFNSSQVASNSVR
jgi:ribose/xylose/arabinose/galactoside ABC-type transport system permease subunit